MKMNQVDKSRKNWLDLGTKTDNYLKDSNDEDKKVKDIKTCVIKRKLLFQDYKNCLQAAHIEIKINHSEKLMQIALTKMKKSS